MSAKSNPLLYTSQKLSGEWSAANFAANLDAEMADKLFDEWPKLDTGVRMRILLSTLFMTQQQRDSIQDPMHRIIDRASTCCSVNAKRLFFTNTALSWLWGGG